MNAVSEPVMAEPKVWIHAELCPLCGNGQVIRLPDDWQKQVDDGRAVPIISCGNPWHYANFDREAVA